MKPVIAFALAGAAVAAVAVAVNIAQPDAVAPRGAGETLLPDLRAADADAIAAITVSQGDQATRIERDAAGVWRVDALNGYPADPAVIRRALTGLAGLARLERRTAKPAFHPRLDLAPAGAADGPARKATVFDADGEILASILLGRMGRDLGGGVSTVFVRAPDDDQTWLAQGAADVAVDPLAWVDNRILDIRQERVQRVDVLVPSEGAPYAVLRDARDQNDPALEPMPAGQELTTPGAARVMAFALDSLRFDAVRRRPAGVEGRIVTEIRLFDGLVVAVEQVDIDGVEWLAFRPRFVAPDAPVPDAAFASDRSDAAGPKRTAEAEAASLAEALTPWVFNPPPARAARFQRPAAEMTQDVEG